MKITAIKQQVKRADRYSIYVDGTYAFSFGESELLKTGLHNGQELAPGEIDELRQKSALDKIYDRALNYAVLRPRSEYELKTYLLRKKCEPEAVQIILDKLAEYGYVSDQNFARSWVASRRLLKNTSKRRLSQELRAKGVNSEVIQLVLADDEVDDRESLRELVTKKRRILRYQDNQKLMQYLSRQGYNYEDIKNALD